MKGMVQKYKELERAKQQTAEHGEVEPKDSTEALRKMLKQDSLEETSPDRFERNTAQLLSEENLEMYEISAGIKDSVRPGDYLMSSMGEREKNELLLKAQVDVVIVQVQSGTEDTHVPTARSIKALRAAADDPEVSVVVVTGTGRAFSAGTDLSEMQAYIADPDNFPGAYGTGFIALVDALTAFPKPLICAVNGLGLGIGTTILGFADLAFMADNARLKCPFTSLGVAPEAASSYLLPQLIGRQNAAWLLLSSEWVGAQEAREKSARRQCPVTHATGEASEGETS
mgnify:CR=1 FL=1